MIHYDSRANNSNEALLMDKKNKFSKISFILPISPSKVEEYMFSVNEIKEFNYTVIHYDSRANNSNVRYQYRLNYSYLKIFRNS